MYVATVTPARAQIKLSAQSRARLVAWTHAVTSAWVGHDGGRAERGARGHGLVLLEVWGGAKRLN
jgi:hypothetical protein